MGVIRRIADTLQNVVANLGTERDKASHTTYVDRIFTPSELLTIYRNSWLARAIVDYPAEDATRKWRGWRADADQITKIEKLEKKLGLQKRTQEGLIAARLYGGAAIYINTADADQSTPLTAGKEIVSLVVLTPSVLRPDPIIKDISSKYYGKPELYSLTSSVDAKNIKIHASRLVVFSGDDIPQDAAAATVMSVQGWGDSILQAAIDAVEQADTSMANMASLVFEAKVDVLKFKGYANLLAGDNDDLVTRRLSLQAAMKGINGALVIDGEDDYQQKSANFSGLPDVVTKFMDAVSGASRIPVTRLYGRASAGLSGSGDGDERVYYDRIGNLQATDITPALELLDNCIIHQALGSRPEEIYYDWRPLRQQTESERAEIFSKTATAARALAGANAGEIIPLDALSESLVNEFTEMGVLPGLDQAVEEYGSLAEQGLPADGDLDNRMTVGDAAPRSLYVSRKVLNAAEILAHYEAQGVGGLVYPDAMHVTITYSRTPVDWMKMGETWSGDDDGEISIKAGGARIMEAFGPDRDTAVLSFVSSNLSWRHEDMVRNGASWDWPEYQPHVTIAYAFSGDIEAIEPWRGEIKLGPEIFEEIDENWSDDK